MAVVGAGDGKEEGGAIVDRAVSAARAQAMGQVARDEARAGLITWADLLKLVLEVDALRCPSCGGRMRLIAAIT